MRYISISTCGVTIYVRSSGIKYAFLPNIPNCLETGGYHKGKRHSQHGVSVRFHNISRLNDCLFNAIKVVNKILLVLRMSGSISK